MRTKLTIKEPQAALDRLLDALARELTYVSEDEVLAAAKELGMNPMMRGSAAFLGLRIPPIADLADWAEFFGSDHFKTAIAALGTKKEGPPGLLEPEAKVKHAKQSPTVDRKH
jgi:hypothetical protein